MAKATRLASALLTLAMSGAARAEDLPAGGWSGPVLVSPGGAGSEGHVGSGCPTFSWALVPGATAYEIVIWRLGDKTAPPDEPLLRHELPAGAGSWTAELPQCLAAGRYGWAVAAIAGAGALATERWSRPTVFRVELEREPPAAAPRAPEPRTAVIASPTTAPPTPQRRAAGAGSPRALTAEAYVPGPCVVDGEMFDDVPEGDPYCRWIEQLVRDGIASGCGVGVYCPKNPVTREQLALYLERAMRGTASWSPALAAPATAPPAGNTLTQVDDPGNIVGSYTSVTIGADGLPIMSYHDSTAGALKVAKCNDVACTGSDETVNFVDNPGNDVVGRHSSIAIGTDGLPIISYENFSDHTLKVAHCSDLACAGKLINTVDDPDNEVGEYTSIAIGSDGLPIISYRDFFDTAVKVAHCNDPLCDDAATISTINDPGNVGEYTSIAIGADGLPVISYRGSPDLKVAHCNDLACSGANETVNDVQHPVLGNSVGECTSITIGVDGLPLISYRDATNGALWVAHCNDPACAGDDESIGIVDDPVNTLGCGSITIGSDGLPIVAYQDVSACTLKVAHCNDLACAGSDEVITVLDDPANLVGGFPAITIGADGLPVIAYFDDTFDSLKVAHCANAFCTPFFRRR